MLANHDQLFFITEMEEWVRKENLDISFITFILNWKSGLQSQAKQKQKH